jgi:hypothetical protein
MAYKTRTVESTKYSARVSSMQEAMIMTRAMSYIDRRDQSVTPDAQLQPICRQFEVAYSPRSL